MEIPKGPFDIIVADPPWSFKTYSKKGMKKSAENHYQCMKTDEIKSMKVPAAKDCILWLWATSPMLLDAIETMKAWGFKYKSSMVWDKKIIAHGYWSRNQHELILIGTKGSNRAPNNKIRRSSVISEKRTRHSKKPDALQDYIDLAYPNKKKIELFARRQRKGWVVWGNEV